MRAARALAAGPLTVLVALLGGCGGGEDTSATVAGPAEPIGYEIFIGYPPTVRSIRIDADGNAATSAQYRGDPRVHRRRFTVPADQLSSIRDHLAAADLGDLPDDECVDCIFVTLSYGDEQAKGGTTVQPQDHEDTPGDLRVALELLADLLPPAEQPGGGANDS